MLSLHNATAQRGGNTLLNNVSLSVAAGECVVIVGPNGAGKSSALKALSGDLTLQSGEVHLNDTAIDQFTPLELAQRRAVLTQSYDLAFPFSVTEVVEMASFCHQEQCSKQQLADYARKAIDEVEVNHLAHKCFTTLSGGEQQRVQLARVLAQLSPALEPSIIAKQGTPYLLIDEPTSSLDLYHQYHVMSLARAAADRGAGVIIVVHDLSLAASFADKLYVLKSGKLVTSGKARDVLTSDVLRDVYNVDASLTLASGQLPHLVISQHNDCITQRT
ncbi:MAG TPA: heme ABC transporter ATP-binding protein [Colwellia sp.]|nr:heme ABC transporter ATP-binding protein [Colwellia sp.]|tara:strand:+ start:7791 stop:8615 length:825 start_codon:yes stop_codon:yes gene_type:complete